VTATVGVDLIEIERVRRALARYPSFRERCFTETERAYCDSRPNPAQHYAARFAGKEAVESNYRQLWASMRNVTFQPLQRIATEDRVVDDCTVTFEVAKAGYWHFPVGSKVEMRLVHIFEMRDGKIAREIVFDMGRSV